MSWFLAMPRSFSETFLYSFCLRAAGDSFSAISSVTRYIRACSLGKRKMVLPTEIFFEA